MTFTNIGNLILQKLYQITKIVGGIEMKSAIPFQFNSIQFHLAIPIPIPRLAIPIPIPILELELELLSIPIPIPELTPTLNLFSSPLILLRCVTEIKLA